ncbi:MAG: phosphatase PAP2 family protein [Deltaproteobacteria bacterium]|nr:phosphatase PAP2 family protein [Deltaproteobacteria bacterium]
MHFEGRRIRFDGKSKEIAGLFAIFAVLIVSGYLYLDIRLARFISEEVGDGFLLSRPISNIPDSLLLLVCVMTLVSWAGRLYLLRKPAWLRYADFLEYVGLALPMAFLFKAVLKDLFGRIDARAWLLHSGGLSFHWFHGGGAFSGFPSGHMAVFTVLMIGISRYFPRLRFLCFALLLALALALMITQYHFFSDIVAGVSVGVIVDLLVRWGLTLWRRLAGRRACMRATT